MGKSCIRFKKLDDVPLEVVGAAVKKVPVNKYLAFYEAAIHQPKGGGKRAGAKKKSAAGKKTSARKK